MKTEEELYQIVVEEIRTGSLVEHLYAKAFAEADGDKNKAKARYLKYRVSQLKSEFKAANSEGNNRSDRNSNWLNQTLYPAIKRYWSKFLDIQIENPSVGKILTLFGFLVICLVVAAFIDFIDWLFG